MAVNWLLSGHGYVVMKKQYNRMNYKTCSRRTYYKYQNEAAEEIIDYVKDGCSQYASNIEDGSYVSIDAQ